MAEIVNLRMARKARRRTEKERLASENRSRFGMTRAERASIAGEQARAEAALDGHRREPPEDE